MIDLLKFSGIPVYIHKIWKKLNAKSLDVKFIENIDKFLINKNQPFKKALISLSPFAWTQALKKAPNINSFNVAGFIYEMVKTLNENEYIVDIVDLNNEQFFPKKDYDIYIGHGGKCKNILDNLPDKCKILQYASGAYWKEFNRESEERYRRFIKRNNAQEKLEFKRSLAGLEEGEEYLTSRAHKIISFNCPRMVNTFGRYKEKFYFTGWGAYIDGLLKCDIEERNFESGRKNFIYVGGTGGNIQKGMDLIIETFARLPNLNLYIYCFIEKPILKYYKKELKLKNIKFIYHWRFKPFRGRLKSLIKKINFSIHAPINTGTGTAFNGSMGAGFIPVGYIDIVPPENSAVLTDDWNVDSLLKCVTEASEKPAEWYKNASKLIAEYFNENWSVESFRKKFNELIRTIDGMQDLRK